MVNWPPRPSWFPSPVLPPHLTFSPEGVLQDEEVCVRLITNNHSERIHRGNQKKHWLTGEGEIFILSIDLFSEQFPLSRSSTCTDSSLNSPTCFHWSDRKWVWQSELAWGWNRNFIWAGCLSCRGKLWFQALLWHYFLFPHWQKTERVISLIGIIMG